MSQLASLARAIRTVLPKLTMALCLAPAAAAQTGWNLGPELRIASSLSGFGITIASDGERLAVGAPLESNGGLVDVGTVELYRRDPAGWISEGRLDPFDLTGLTQAQWGFGGAIDVAGELVVVGTPGHDGVCPSQFFCNSGAAYVFQRVAGQWTPDQILIPAGLEDNDKLGGAVAVAGNQLLVSATGDNDGGLLCGAVYVWEQVGGAWTVVQKLLPNDAQPRMSFGSNLRADGDTLIVGAPGHPQGSSFTNTQGGAYIFRRTGGTWSQEAALLPDSFSNSDFRFGAAVDISGDSAVVGVPGRNSHNTRDGAAYVFERIGATWTQTQILTVTGLLSLDQFGSALAIAGDRMIVGKSRVNSGAPRDVQVYERIGQTWNHAFELVPTLPDPANYIGREMVMTEDSMFFGSSTPAAYVFDIETHWATFCDATPNATGGVGRIEVGGSASLAANNLQLTAAGLTPQQFGFFLVGDASHPQGVIPPGSLGRLCLAGSIGRYLGPGQLQNTGATGTMSLAVDLGAIPGPTGSIASMVGSVWNFQAWHRDIGTQPTSNLTQALSLIVQ